MNSKTERSVCAVRSAGEESRENILDTSQQKKSKTTTRKGSKSTSPKKANREEVLLFWHTATNKLDEQPGVSMERTNIEYGGKLIGVLAISGMTWDDAGNPVLDAGN